MSAYSAWESKKMVEYTELKDKYKSIKEQENSLSQLTSCKKNKKEMLLNGKLDGTISCEGRFELEYIDREESIERDYERNVATIVAARERAIREAHEKYETALKYYDLEKERSFGKAKRILDSKMGTIAKQKQKIDVERNVSMKTAAELMIEKQKREILKKMKEMIEGIDMARSQIPEKERDFVFDVPELPEPIVDAHVMTTPVAPVPKPKRLVTEEQWMAMGEDATNQQLREQARMEKSIRPEYEVRPNPTPYGVIGIAKDVDKLYVKPAQTEEDEEDDYDPEYVAKRREELKKMHFVSA
jgi:hypothetical protein